MKVPIVKYPSNILTTPAREITREELQDEKYLQSMLQPVINDMIASMTESKGVGLAAPQIGWGLRVIVFKTAKGVKHLINPEITKTSVQRLPEAEGCLSLPGFRAYVMRHRSITVRGIELTSEELPRFKAVLFKAEHDEARVIQHEVDHLDGVLMTSRVGALDRERAAAFLHVMANPMTDPLVVAGA